MIQLGPLHAKPVHTRPGEVVMYSDKLKSKEGHPDAINREYVLLTILAWEATLSMLHPEEWVDL